MNLLFSRARLLAFFTKPMTKRFMLAIPIIVAINLARWWFGTEQSALIGLLTGVVSVALADMLLSNKVLRRKRLEQVQDFLREHGLAPVQMSVWLCISVGAFALHRTPSDSLVQQIGHFVEVFGLLFVVGYPAISSFLYKSPPSFVVSSFLQGIGAYAVALWAIGEFGDSLMAFAKANPSEAIAFLVAMAVIREISHFIGGAPAEPQEISRQAAGIATLLPPTERDHRYTAAHESGHALVYAALDKLPSDLRLVVQSEADNTGVLGFVTGINSDHHLQEKTFTEWYMLVFLAGKLGETVLLGESTLGSTNDHRRWLNLARNYLSNHYRGPFYAEPSTKFEQEQNDQKLETLQLEQLELLQSLFDMNAEIFKELADTLLAKRTMVVDDLQPFVARVTLPEGFPRPNNINSPPQQ